MGGGDYSFLESKTVVSDLADAFVGKKIGEGSTRKVFECKIDSSLVVKIEEGVYMFQNIVEWIVWNEVKEIKKARSFLAPCVFISPCGTLLLQKRTTPFPPQKVNFPKYLPSFLSDEKPENYGMLDGRLVCHDYGSVLLNRADFKSRKARWILQ